ncbi:MAG: hypothetical protein ACYSWQ_16080 [Planctomycetota bacterium]
MRRFGLILIAFALLLSLSTPAFAPIFGFFPGLDELISRSDAILVVDLLKEKSSSPREVYEDCEVYVRKVIKGEAVQNKKMILSLRFLPFISSRKPDSKIMLSGFRTGDRHIVFLSKNNKPDKASYSSLNYSGGHMRVSHQSDLSKLEADEPKQIISELLEDFVKYKRQELENLEYQVNTILGKE